MPIIQNVKDAHWNASDLVEFKQGVEKMRKLMAFPSNHFTSNEILILKAMGKKLNEIADAFEETEEHSPLVGYEITGLSGLHASMGITTTNDVNRHRIWDGTAYLTELNSDDY